MEDLLRKAGLDPNNLNPEEVRTLQQWQEALAKNQLSVPSVKMYVDGMITALEKELFDYATPPSIVALLFRRKRRRNIEARLLNYVMLRDFLVAPEKARQFVEAQLQSLKMR